MPGTTKAADLAARQQFEIPAELAVYGPVIQRRIYEITFAGIAPASVVPFIAAQFIGTIAATALARWFYPTVTDMADDLVIRRSA